MTTFKLHCPSCNQKLEAYTEWIGETVVCPACGQMIMLTASTKIELITATLPASSTVTTRRKALKFFFFSIKHKVHTAITWSSRWFKCSGRTLQNITLWIVRQTLQFLRWLYPHLVKLNQKIVAELKYFWLVCSKKYLPVLTEKYLIIQAEGCRIWNSMSRRKKYRVAIGGLLIIMCIVFCLYFWIASEDSDVVNVSYFDAIQTAECIIERKYQGTARKLALIRFREIVDSKQSETRKIKLLKEAFFSSSSNVETVATKQEILVQPSAPTEEEMAKERLINSLERLQQLIQLERIRQNQQGGFPSSASSNYQFSNTPSSQPYRTQEPTRVIVEPYTYADAAKGKRPDIIIKPLQASDVIK